MIRKALMSEPPICVCVCVCPPPRVRYTMTMDCHERFRTEQHGLVVPRFNERFILSLSGCRACLVLDDELNILPISGSVHIGAPTTLWEKNKERRKDLACLRGSPSWLVCVERGGAHKIRETSKKRQHLACCWRRLFTGTRPFFFRGRVSVRRAGD